MRRVIMEVLSIISAEHLSQINSRKHEDNQRQQTGNSGTSARFKQHEGFPVHSSRQRFRGSIGAPCVITQIRSKT